MWFPPVPEGRTWLNYISNCFITLRFLTLPEGSKIARRKDTWNIRKHGCFMRKADIRLSLKAPPKKVTVVVWRKVWFQISPHTTTDTHTHTKIQDELLRSSKSFFISPKSTGYKLSSRHVPLVVAVTMGRVIPWTWMDWSQPGHPWEGLGHFWIFFFFLLAFPY